MVAVFGDITDPASRQIGVDDLLNQVMLCWKQSRAAVDELLTAKFDLSDKVSDSASTVLLDALVVLSASPHASGGLTRLLSVLLQDFSSDLDLEEFKQLIGSVDVDGTISSKEIVRMFKGLSEDAADEEGDEGVQMDLTSFLFMCTRPPALRRSCLF